MMLRRGLRRGHRAGRPGAAPDAARGALRRGKEIAGRLAERRGIDAAPRPPAACCGCMPPASGETVSVLPVLSALATRAPDLTVLLTTGTVTSAELLARRLPELGLERRVLHRFVPLDVPAWAARFLDHWRPDAAAFVESEIWPNLLAGCARRDIPLMLVNARLSARSFAHWRRLPGFARICSAASRWCRRSRRPTRHGCRPSARRRARAPAT